MVKCIDTMVSSPGEVVYHTIGSLQPLVTKVGGFQWLAAASVMCISRTPLIPLLLEQYHGEKIPDSPATSCRSLGMNSSVAAAEIQWSLGGS